MSGFGATLQAAWPYAAAVLVVLGAIALGALIVVFIRLAQVMKKTNGTLDEVNELVAKTNKELQPALERIDPMLEKANLSMDTLNLELLRVDAILEDVESITNAADKTVTTVEKVTAAPTDAVAGIAGKIRGKFGSRSASSTAQKKFVYPAGKEADKGAESLPATEAAKPAHSAEAEAAPKPETAELHEAEKPEEPKRESAEQDAPASEAMAGEKLAGAAEEKLADASDAAEKAEEGATTQDAASN